MPGKIWTEVETIFYNLQENNGIIHAHMHPFSKTLDLLDTFNNVNEKREEFKVCHNSLKTSRYLFATVLKILFVRSPGTNFCSN